MGQVRREVTLTEKTSENSTQVHYTADRLPVKAFALGKFAGFLKS